MRKNGFSTHSREPLYVVPRNDLYSPVFIYIQSFVTFNASHLTHRAYCAAPYSLRSSRYFSRSLPEKESRVLLAFERTGEVLTCACALCFSDFNWQGYSAWTWWLFAAALLMLFYELWWIRYFRSERKLSDFYSSFLGIPVAGATLPVAAFLLLGIYGKVFWLIISAVILGIGHIGIHLVHRKEIFIE